MRAALLRVGIGANKNNQRRGSRDASRDTRLEST